MVPNKIPKVFTLTIITLYLIFFSFIAINSGSGVLVSVLVFLATMPFLGMVAFAISAAFCAVLCRKHKKEISECQESIRLSVSKVVDMKRVRSGTIEPDINYQLVCAIKKEGLQ